MVGHEVAGDGDEPGAEVAALPGEGADAAQCAQERLAGEVLGGGFAADAVIDVPVHGVAVLVVEAAEGVGLAGLGAFDEVHHPGAVAVRGRAAGGGGAGGAAASADGGGAAVGEGVARADGGAGYG